MDEINLRQPPSCHVLFERRALALGILPDDPDVRELAVREFCTNPGCDDQRFVEILQEAGWANR
jgi:hypothetical protein